MRTRILAVFSTLVLAVCGAVGLAIPAQAATCDYSVGSWNTWAQLQNAVSGSTAGQTICFQSDWTIGQSLMVASGKDISLDLQGHTISFDAQADYAGIEVPAGAALTITDTVGSGILNATGGATSSGHGGAAGIGASASASPSGHHAGAVTILAGTVNARGGVSQFEASGAGIGGSGSKSNAFDLCVGGYGGTVIIRGGHVNATGGDVSGTSYSGAGAGIGGGGTGNCRASDLGHSEVDNVGGSGGTVTITGGFVVATGGASGDAQLSSSGAGIGGGGSGTCDNRRGLNAFSYGGAGATVTISGGSVIATAGVGDVSFQGPSAAAIGGGGAGQAFGGSGSQVATSGVVGALLVNAVSASGTILTAGNGFNGNLHAAAGVAPAVTIGTTPSGVAFAQTGSYNATQTVPAKAVINFLYSVTFSADGGSSTSPQQTGYGSAIAQPTPPTKSGFTFAGWLLSGSAYTFSSAVTSPVSLTASWTSDSVPSQASALPATGADQGPALALAGTLFLAGLTLLLYRRRVRS